MRTGILSISGFQCEMITETEVLGENHRFDAIHKQCVSHNVVSSIHRHWHEAISDFYM
jgi:hypothetical protein